ncbi:MAG: cardiolipin synthase B [Acidobacteria bacterium]|nr:MAG: cardiolipin synthase B [Acidobacteriota bacterium]
MASKREAGGKKRRYPWWLEMLAAFGVASTITVVLTLFFAIGRRPSRLVPTQSPAVDSPEFLAAVAGTAGTPIRAGGTIRLLNNGVEFFPALLQALHEAKHTIDFAVYIWEPGQACDDVSTALIERARAGVQVRVLLDGMGALKIPGDTVDAMKKAGVKVETFRPARFGKLTRFHKRNHRRAIVIDGEVGFTGGAAVADKWAGDADTPEHWRDTMVKVTGPPASTLQSAFAQTWAYSGGELIAGSTFFPPEGTRGTAGGMLHTGIASAPSSDDHPLTLFFIQSFAAARRRLYITTPYFVPDESTRRVVEERARAGVDVRILLPDQHTDAKPIRLASHRYYEELLESGVGVYEYQGTMMHTKGVVVDGQWSVVGSANMDIRSKELNMENVLGVLDARFAAELETAFHKDLGKAREIRLEQWRRRSWLARIGERFCALFGEQY